MAKKRKTLPKDFEELLKKGDLEELKAVFDKYELDARGGYAKETALAYDRCLIQGIIIFAWHSTIRRGFIPLYS
jgi:hypothetical protein